MAVVHNFISFKVDDEDIEKICEAFHETYFGHFWIRGRGYKPDRDSWLKFNEKHKEALRATFKDVIERELIGIPAPNVSKPKYTEGD